MKKFKHLCMAALFSAAFPLASQAAVVVYVDFTSDVRDGTAGGSANGTADWIDELNQATADAGVANFSAGERTTIQSNILSQLATMYSGYDITFTTTSPGGSFDTLTFGTDEVTAGVGVLGFAPLDIGNTAVNTASMAPRNFNFFIESGDARATQIAEISRGFSGTAAHELGHSFGLLHHHAYGDPGITPANYANTGGIQNTHIMATGPTGLTEIERETARTFSGFSRVMLDITGGTVFGGNSLVTAPIIEVNETGDIGNTTGTAQAMTFSTGESSNYQIALRRGDLDGSGADADLYSFTITSPSLFSAHLYSTVFFATPFDGALTLLASDGTTVLATNDDVRFSGNAYNSGAVDLIDPFLNNIVLNALGTYYLRVSVVASGAIGDDYELVAAYTSIPEPASLAMLALGSVLIVRRRRA